MVTVVEGNSENVKVSKVILSVTVKLRWRFRG